MISTRSLNRKNWTAGPWDQEDDKYEWIDEKTGYYCLIHRNDLGALCGYVGLREDHPCYGKEDEAYQLDAHGGITYANETIVEDKQYWIIGFDCAHLGDAFPVGRFNINPYDSYRDYNYVKAEVDSLTIQLFEKDPFNSLIQSIRNEIL